MSLITIQTQFTRRTLFTFEAENNSPKITLEAAVRANTALQGADLQGLELQYAHLTDAYLRNANFAQATLYSANLERADLRGAVLHDVNLDGAHLQGANLEDADLLGATLVDADLRHTHLRGARLQGAALREAKHARFLEAHLSIVPEQGAFEGWKKCGDQVLVHVRIPAEARRSSAAGRKCRAEYVDVLAVEGAMEGVSLYDRRVRYRVGERVWCHAWEADPWTECGGGIHFMLTRIEAEYYA